MKLREFFAHYVYLSRYARPDLGVLRWEQSVEAASRTLRQHYSIPHSKWERLTGLDLRLAKSRALVPSMRLIQYLQACLTKNERVYNCCGMLTYREVFRDATYLLLCGTGCGVNISRRWVERLPALRPVDPRDTRTVVVEDSIGGWADAVQAVIESYWGGYTVQFDYSQVTPEGTILRSCGRPACGPGPLQRSIEDIRRLLAGKVERRDFTLRPIDVLDIICLAAQCVLAGGVRRSALLFAFDADDTEMMHAKSAESEWWVRHPHRAFANISVIVPPSQRRARRDELRQTFKTAYAFGEPGVLFIEDDQIVNPCAEIVFRPHIDGEPGFQFCNLSEVNLGACTSPADVVRAAEQAAIWGTLQSGFTTLNTRNNVAKALVVNEPLLGVSITGLFATPSDHVRHQCIWGDTLSRAARTVIDTNAKLAPRLGLRPAVRHTCVKPSGTVSSLLGVTPGVHPSPFTRYLRHAQERHGSVLSQWYRQVLGDEYIVDLSNMYPNTEALPFPIDGKHVISWNDVDVRSICTIVTNITKNYIEMGYNPRHSTFPNSVSFTFMVGESDLNTVIDWLLTSDVVPTGTTIFPNTVPEGFPALPYHPLVTDEKRNVWMSLAEVIRGLDGDRLPLPQWSGIRAEVYDYCDGDSCTLRSIASPSKACAEDGS